MPNYVFIFLWYGLKLFSAEISHNSCLTNFLLFAFFTSILRKGGRKYLKPHFHPLGQNATHWPNQRCSYKGKMPCWLSEFSVIWGNLPENPIYKTSGHYSESGGDSCVLFFQQIIPPEKGWIKNKRTTY